jgi:hypothetical protein
VLVVVVSFIIVFLYCVVLCLCVMCVTCLFYCCTTANGLKLNCSLTNIYIYLKVTRMGELGTTLAITSN